MRHLAYTRHFPEQRLLMKNAPNYAPFLAVLGGGGSTCRLSVKISLLCRLSVKIVDLCPLSVNLS